MRVLVCGSREWDDTGAVLDRLAELPANTLVIHGGARGADRTAGRCAGAMGLHAAEIRALWDYNGNAAGRIRNEVMLDLEPDLVIAFWDGTSRGTAHTIEEARKRGIPVEVVRP